MKADPPRRKDGRCAREGCTKTIRAYRPPTKDVPKWVADNEPFCSSTCCRAYHGFPIVAAEDEERIERQAVLAREACERSGYGRDKAAA